MSKGFCSACSLDLAQCVNRISAFRDLCVFGFSTLLMHTHPVPVTGSMANDTSASADMDDVAMAAPSAPRSTTPAPAVEEPFAQELRVQLRNLKQQKSEVEAALQQQKVDAEAREQELLIEVANAQHTSSEEQQLRVGLEEV